MGLDKILALASRLHRVGAVGITQAADGLALAVDHVGTLLDVHAAVDGASVGILGLVDRALPQPCRQALAEVWDLGQLLGEVGVGPDVRVSGRDGGWGSGCSRLRSGRLRGGGLRGGGFGSARWTDQLVAKCIAEHAVVRRRYGGLSRDDVVQQVCPCRA